MFLDYNTAKGFPLYRWFEYQSGNIHQNILLAPSGLQVLMDIEVESTAPALPISPIFTFSKPYCDGTCRYNGKKKDTG